jgi:NitT/TauT family transport system permease protein
MSSKEQLLYLKKLKKFRLLVTLAQLLIFIIFIATWEVLARLKLINTFLFSSPGDIIHTIINLHKANNLYPHIFITIYETFISFSLATIIGLLVATLFWWNNFVAKVVSPYLTVLNSLPKVALGPIIIIWVGANTNSIVLMALLISTFITIINLYDSFINSDENRIRLLKAFKATKMDIFFKAVLPGSWANIINALKINVSMSLIGVIMGELLVSKKGIGYLIMYGSQVFNLNLIMTGIIILGIVAFAMYYIIARIEREIIKKTS